MINFFRRQRRNRAHLGYESLARMISDRLLRKKRILARRHLHESRQCQARCALPARPVPEFIEHSRDEVERFRTLSRLRRDQFIERLDLVLKSMPNAPRWNPQFWGSGVRPFGTAVPGPGARLILLLAGIVFVLVWRSRVPSVSASELLDRAVVSDLNHLGTTGSGVIRQRLRIRARKKTFEHAVYHDISGSRRPRTARLGTEESDLEINLALAGVNWDDPLSAASFKSWHDRQSGRKDEINYPSVGLLTITTRLRATQIAQESFTMMDNDFHPLERTITYREGGDIDITEISSDVLSSDMANQLFSEPQPREGAVSRRVSVHALIPNPGQIDETELRARLILSQQNADTGEQIEVSRDSNGVRVQGLVENDERRLQLIESLGDVPFLATNIKSFDDLKSASVVRSQIHSVAQQSVVVEVSPLEQYFVQHGRSREDRSRISAGLFNTSLSIDRSCRNLERLRHRFSASENLSSTAIDARDELRRRNSARLLEDLDEQQHLLTDAEINPAPAVVESSGLEAMDADLTHLAERNAAVTRELISGGLGPGTSVERAGAELAAIISQMRAATLRIHSAPQH